MMNKEQAKEVIRIVAEETELRVRLAKVWERKNELAADLMTEHFDIEAMGMKRPWDALVGWANSILLDGGA